VETALFSRLKNKNIFSVKGYLNPRDANHADLRKRTLVPDWQVQQRFASQFLQNKQRGDGSGK